MASRPPGPARRPQPRRTRNAGGSSSTAGFWATAARSPVFPARPGPADPEIVLALIFEGEQALNRIDAPRMLDRLMRQGVLPPVVAVLVLSIDGRTRAWELPGTPLFAQALAEELPPRVAAETGIRPSPPAPSWPGQAMAGLVPPRRPDAFGNAIAMSGSFRCARGRGVGRHPLRRRGLCRARETADPVFPQRRAFRDRACRHCGHPGNLAAIARRAAA